MTAAQPAEFVVQLLDPRELVSHPRNVRADLGDLTGLTASIAAQGVIEPLTVVPIVDGHQIVAGHRRAAASVEAGLQLVPCVVRADLADRLFEGDVDRERQAAHVGAMLAENLHREGLTAMEEARGVKQMLDLGVPISRVAKSTGLGQKRVKKAIGVARLDDNTAAAVEAQQLDLDTAAVIAQFADEPETTATLLRAAERGPGQLAHAVEQVKQIRKAEEQMLTRAAELREAGRVVVESFAPDGARLTRLNASDGTWLADKEAEHRSCPGSAVHLTTSSWDGVHEEEVCTDWKANGHLDRWASSSSTSKPETPEEKEAAKAERREVIQNNQLMAAANSVRRAWLKDFFARRSSPPEVLRFAVEAIAANPSALRGWLGSESAIEKDVDVALGVQKPVRPWSMSTSDRQVRTTLTTGEHVSDARLPLQLLAHIAGGIESNIPKDAWRRGSPVDSEIVHWLTFLVGQGYELSDVEQQIVDGAAK